MNKTMDKIQEKLKKNADFPQETNNNTPSKNDQDTHFFYIFLVYKPIQTPSNCSNTIGNDRNYLKLIEKKNQKRSRKSKTIKSDQGLQKTIKSDKKIEKQSKIFKIFFFQESELGQFGIILDRFWNF